jgi:zinc protease
MTAPVEATTPAAASRRRGRLTIQRAVLSNGIVVLGAENHTHPSVVIRLSLRAAPVLDAPETAGLAALTASGLTRGTRRRTFAEINETVDACGMGFGSGAGRHTSTVSARCLPEDLGLAIDLIADVVQYPTFPEPEIAQLRGQVLTGLRQADDDTAAVADRHFRELLYPPGHPYRLRSHGYQETVARLTHEHLAAFHATTYGPGGAYCVVVGDVEFDDVVRRLEDALGGWAGASPPLPDLGRPPSPPPQQLEVALEGKAQSDLVVGCPGIRRRDPDYYALAMANMILGRLAMMGRLGETVRETQGLAYGVHSELDASLGAGPWCVRAGVNPVNVDRALAAIGDELKRIREEGITEDELVRGQRYSIGSLVLRLETNDGIAGIIQDIHLFDLGLDYIERYPQIVTGLTRDQVSAAAARYIPRLEDAVRVIAGPPRR